jgi:outer membrane murein-binding lipoprotein Lpp
MIEPAKDDNAAAQRRFNVSAMQAMDAMAAQLRELEARINLLTNRAAVDVVPPSVELLSSEVASLKQSVNAIRDRIDTITTDAKFAEA